jgi:hypothetical protein
MNKIAAYAALLEDHPLWKEDFEKLAGGATGPAAAADLAFFLGGLSLLGAGAGALASEEGNRTSGALRGAVAGAAVPTAMIYAPHVIRRGYPRLGERLDRASILAALASPSVAPLAGYLAAKHLER